MKIKQAFQQSLSNKTPLEQLSWIGTLLLSFAVIVLGALQLLGVLGNALSIALPIMAVVMLLQSYNFRKISKFSSIASLVGAIVLAALVLTAYANI